MKIFEEKFKKKFLKRFFTACVVLGLALILSGLPSFATEKVYFYHTDAAGTPVAMTDASGNVVWRADYKPFGEEQSVTPLPENNKRFIGKEKDEETGLYYFGARYMDAGIGRFTSVDPAGITEKDLLNPQRLNRYNYSLNNPYRYVDVDGREVILTSHIVALWRRHSALLLRPDDQNKNWGTYGFKKDISGRWYATLSAGPDRVWNPKLKSDINRPTDAPDKNTIDVTIENPFGKSVADDTKFIKELISKDNAYSDNLDYDLTPLLQDGYNSNSYTSGLLESVGATVPQLIGGYPGIHKPVPSNNFDTKKLP